MPETVTITTQFHFATRAKGQRVAVQADPAKDPSPVGRVPRISRLMALAIRFETLLASGEFLDYRELAILNHVTRARITQIMNLNLLAPDIQEEILFLPRIMDGRGEVYLRQLQEISLIPDWGKQRRIWGKLLHEQA